MKKSGTIAFSWGGYGGFNIHKGKTINRICLGWVAFYFIKPEIELVLKKLTHPNTEKDSLKLEELVNDNPQDTGE